MMMIAVITANMSHENKTLFVFLRAPKRRQLLITLSAFQLSAIQNISSANQAQFIAQIT